MMETQIIPPTLYIGFGFRNIWHYRLRGLKVAVYP